MTTPTVIETRRNGNPIRSVGPRVELARYTLPSGEQRIVYGQRVDGVVRVTDAPAAPGSRAYVVERGLEQHDPDSLRALVADYVKQAQVLGDVPMAMCPLAGARTDDLEEA